MQVTTRLKLLLFCLLAGMFFACEEEGEPLTLKDIYEATDNKKKPFKAKINGFDFTADAVAGGKEGSTYYVVGAQSSAASITIKTIDITPGLYLGEDSASNNVFFKNDVGRLFTSNFSDKESDAEISIRSFSEKNSLASGVFSGTLYSLDSDEILEITNGEFNSIFLDIPFFGKMTASANNNSYKADKCSFSVESNGGNVLSTIQSAVNNDTIGISFVVEDTLEVKNYDLEEPVASATYNTNNFSANIFKHQYNAQSGNLRIIRIDTVDGLVVGTFNFEAKTINGESISVRSGKFEALIE